MLKDLTARNFQKHKKKTIDLSHPITTIVGPTESGKTSFIRLLNWICFNKPLGNEFLRWGTKKVGGRLQVDGHVIERIRNGKNLYRLDGKDLKSFGTGVPDPIKRILNLTEENIQDQLDDAFWLSLSPGKIARELNQIVDLSLTDSTLSFLASKLRLAKAKKEVISERLSWAKEEKQRLSYVPRLAKDFKKIESLTQQLQKKREEEDSLDSLIKSIAEKSEELELLPGSPTEIVKGFKVLERLKTSLKSKQQELEFLSILLTDIDRKQTKKKQLKKEIKVLTVKLKKERCPVCGAKLQNR